jgi:hypothetical protein
MEILDGQVSQKDKGLSSAPPVVFHLSYGSRRQTVFPRILAVQSQDSTRVIPPDERDIDWLKELSLLLKIDIDTPISLVWQLSELTHLIIGMSHNPRHKSAKAIFLTLEALILTFAEY